MGKITITDVDDTLARTLDALPSSRRDAIEDELRKAARFLIERADRTGKRRHVADEIAAMTPKVAQSDSTALLREDRDR